MESQGIIVRTGARKNGKWEIIAYPAKVAIYPAKVEVYLAIEEATVAALRGKSRYKIRPPGRSS